MREGTPLKAIVNITLGTLKAALYATGGILGYTTLIAKEVEEATIATAEETAEEAVSFLGNFLSAKKLTQLYNLI